MRLLRLLQQLPARIALGAAPLLRFLAALFLLAAVVLFVASLTQGGTHAAASDQWRAVSPSSYAAFQTGINKRLGEWAWEPMMTTILSMPGYLLFGVLALVCGLAGRRRRVVNVYVN